jgi:hypothetical protein
MTDVPADLEALSVSVRKSLHWSVFLLGAMLLILVIDLQIKRSIGRQAVAVGRMLAASEVLSYQTDRLIADVMGATNGRQSADASGDDADNAGRDGGGHVDGSPGVAAGNGQAGSADEKPKAGRRGRAPQRPPGDGR